MRKRSTYCRRRSSIWRPPPVPGPPTRLNENDRLRGAGRICTRGSGARPCFLEAGTAGGEVGQGRRARERKAGREHSVGLAFVLTEAGGGRPDSDAYLDRRGPAVYSRVVGAGAGADGRAGQDDRHGGRVLRG